MSRPASSPPHAPPSPPGPTRAALPGLRWILAIALVKGLALTALIPPFQTPDEYAHYDYAVYLSRVPPLAFLRGEVTRPTVMRHAEVVTSEVRAVAGAAGVFPHLTDAVLPKRQPLSDMLAAAAAWDGRELDLSHVRTWNAAMNYPPLYHGALAVLLRVQRAAGVNPLLRFYSSRPGGDTELTSLADYAGRMHPEQREIYYLLGDDVRSAAHSPHLDLFRQHKREVLYLVDPLDSFMLAGLQSYEGYALKSADDPSLDLPKPEPSAEAAAEAVPAAEFDAVVERFKASMIL